MIDVEAYIVFLAACFFTLLYMLLRLNGKSANWLGIFGGTSWITLGFLWLLLATEAPAYSTYSVGLLFNGFGIFMIVYVTIDLFNMNRDKRGLATEEGVTLD